MDKVNLYLGDCLIEHEHIEDGSVDLILTDLPYGTMNGFNGIDWDFAIEPKEIFDVSNRTLRKNGKLVLFSQEPYTSNLIINAIPNLMFSYRMIWLKDSFGNALLSNKAHVGLFEDILMFSKRDSDVRSPAKDYTDKIRKFINKGNKEIFKDFEEAGYLKYSVVDTFNSDSALRYGFPTEITYKAFIELYGIDKMDGFINYKEARLPHDLFKDSQKSVFNLWENKKYKADVLEYAKDYGGYHPTQKPILLLEDLIKTFSNEDDLIVDLTMGSGSTGVACVNTSRRFTGIEMDDKYFNIAKERIEGAENKDQTNIFDYL